MVKRSIVSVVLILLILAGYLLFDQSRKTTYQEVIRDLIGEDENVELITVSTQLTFLKQTATVTIDNPELINRFLDEQIKLKKTLKDEPEVFEHALLIKTNKNEYTIGFDLASITADSKKYQTINPTVNPIYMLIQHQDLEWEIGPYSPVLSEE